MSVVYVLMLEHEKWYVGVTNDVLRRWEEHISGAGSMWTRIHRPLKLFFVSAPYADRQTALAHENKVTKTMATMGYDVRGGAYCHTHTTVEERFAEQGMSLSPVDVDFFDEDYRLLFPELS